jgi:hypothetical protein
MLTVFFNHLGGRIPKVDARNRPIAGDSPWKREIFRAAKFPFKIKSNAHLTARLAEFFRAKKVFAQENQFIIFDWDNRVGVRERST